MKHKGGKIRGIGVCGLRNNRGKINRKNGIIEMEIIFGGGILYVVCLCKWGGGLV